MKQVIFRRDDGFYMTSAKNYNSYIWDSHKIKKLQGVNTFDDVMEFIENACTWWTMDPEDFTVISGGTYS